MTHRYRQHSLRTHTAPNTDHRCAETEHECARSASRKYNLARSLIRICEQSHPACVYKNT